MLDLCLSPAVIELAPLLPGTRLVANDSSEVMMRLGAERAGEQGIAIETQVCAAEALEMADDTADVVTAKHFLRLSPDPQAFLAEVLRVLRPGGRLYVVDFSREVSRIKPRLLWLWIRLTAGPDFAAHFFESYRATSMEASKVPAMLEEAGFVDARMLANGLSFLVAASRP